MNPKKLFRKLKAKGFAEVYPGIFVRLATTPARIVGAAYWCTPDGLCMWAGASYSRVKAVELAINQLAGIEIGRRRRWGRRRLGKALRRVGKKWRRRINKAAKRIARAKVLQRLRRVYARVLESPAMGAVIKGASQALRAFGVPPKAAQAVLNQVRFATAARAKEGGWAGMAARATGKGGIKGLMKEILKRQAGAGKKTLKELIPGKAARDALKKLGIGEYEVIGAMPERTLALPGEGMGVGSFYNFGARQ